MVDLRLTPDEAGKLRRVLEHYVSDLRMEIAGTERQDVREDLKGEEVFLKKVIDELQKS